MCNGTTRTIRARSGVLVMGLGVGSWRGAVFGGFGLVDLELPVDAGQFQDLPAALGHRVQIEVRLVDFGPRAVFRRRL